MKFYLLIALQVSLVFCSIGTGNVIDSNTNVDISVNMGNDNHIEYFTVLSGYVNIGNNNRIKHAKIDMGTTIGDNNWITNY